MPRPSNRDRLLDHAEALYAAHGVGAVSLRAIQSAAGLSVGSLRYHFKTETELVAAVMERRVEPLMARHEALVERVASNPDPATSEILRALIQPLLELLVTEPEQGMRYVTLMHRLQVWNQSGPIFIARWPGFAQRTGGLLKKALPHLSEDTIGFRLDLAWETILGSIARSAELSARDLEQHVSALIDYLSGALEAPQTTRLRRNEPTE